MATKKSTAKKTRFKSEPVEKKIAKKSESAKNPTKTGARLVAEFGLFSGSTGCTKPTDKNSHLATSCVELNALMRLIAGKVKNISGFQLKT
jgi:hypothetical protein